MAIVLVGVNHRTAPVELRERLAFSGSTLRRALEALQMYGTDRSTGDKVLQEYVILSTCNRTEIYAIGGSPAAAWDIIEQFIGGFNDLPHHLLRPHLCFLEGDAVIDHLMQVAAGLDSMILGEAQILGQVANAFDEAHEAGTAGAILSHLFAQAIHTGKRARTETNISRQTTSVSHMAALMIQQKLPDLKDCRLLVVGSGEMAVLAAQSLYRGGVRNFMFLNRTYANAETLVHKFGGCACNWTDMDEALAWADVVISATGAPHIVIYADMIQKVLPLRAGRPLLIVDIAVPRDVEEAVDLIPGVERCDVDALQSVVDQHLNHRLEAIPQVEAIIAEEKTAFVEWLNSRQVVHVISNLQHWARSIADAEIEQALHRLKHSEQDAEEVINRLVHRLINKLLHQPTVRLKSQAVKGNGYAYAVALCDLFGLDRDAKLKCVREADTCETAAVGTNVASTTSACNLQCIAAGK